MEKMYCYDLRSLTRFGRYKVTVRNSQTQNVNYDIVLLKLTICINRESGMLCELIKLCEYVLKYDGWERTCVVIYKSRNTISDVVITILKVRILRLNYDLKSRSYEI